MKKWRVKKDIPGFKEGETLDSLWVFIPKENWRVE